MRWVSKVVPKSQLLKNLALSITNAQTSSSWILYYPSNYTEIIDLFVIKTRVNNKEVFIEFYNPDYKNNHYYMECRYGWKYTPPENLHSSGNFEEDCGSVRSRFSWNTLDPKLKEWVPVKYFMEVDEERLIIVLCGSEEYETSLVSPAYFGKITEFKNSSIYLNNFGMFVSSDISPVDYLSKQELYMYGDNTSDGVTSFSMLTTKTGYPFQRNALAFLTCDEFLNEKGNSSKYTNGFGFSKVSIVSPISGYLGRLDNLRIGKFPKLKDKTKLFKYDEDNLTDKIYQLFKINAPYSILNNSPNILSSLAVLCYDKEIDISNSTLLLNPSSQSIQAGDTAKFVLELDGDNITNLDSVSWSCSETSYFINKGILRSSEVFTTATVTAIYKGKMATASIIVVEPEFYISPSKVITSIGVENLEYRCYYGSRELTDSAVWALQDNLGSLESNKFSSNGYPGNTKILATYHLGDRIKTASSELIINDVEFKLVCESNLIAINNKVKIKAMFGDIDISNVVSWSIDNSYIIDTTGLTSQLTKEGIVTVTAVYEKCHKSSSIELTVKDNRVLTVSPQNKRVALGTLDEVQYTAKLDDLDVSSQVNWEITSPLVINSSGLATNLTQELVASVSAYYAESDKRATTSLILFSEIINHSFDYYFQLDWDLIQGLDLDIQASALGHVINYGTPKYVTGTGGVWLDHDNTRQTIDSDANRYLNKYIETMSLFGLLDVPVTITVKNSSNLYMSTNANLKIYDKNSNLIKVIPISIQALPPHGITSVVRFTSHVNNQYEIIQL